MWSARSNGVSRLLDCRTIWQSRCRDGRFVTDYSAGVACRAGPDGHAPSHTGRVLAATNARWSGCCADVLADETNGYQPTQRCLVGSDQARKAWLWIELHGDTAAVDRLPDYAAYPIRSGPSRLFTLAPDEVAATGPTSASPAVAARTGGTTSSGRFGSPTLQPAPTCSRHAHYTRDIDERVHLDGGRQHRSTKRSPA